MLPILFFNVNIILKSIKNSEEVPTLFGITPMIVLTDSMNTKRASITAGDIVFVRNSDVDLLTPDTIILFKVANSLVIHRIVRIEVTENGEKQFITKGDANNIEDAEPVSSQNIVGTYVGRVPIIGHFSLFLRTPLGMTSCIILPLITFTIYDNIRQKQQREELQNILNQHQNGNN